VLEPLILLIELLFLEHKPRPWVVRAFRACLAPFGRRPADLGQETVATLTTKVIRAVPVRQDLSPVPTFVSTSNPQSWMQWEAHNRQHDLTTRLAIESTMPRFSPALFGAPPTA
jgi:hypothetical protein